MWSLVLNKILQLINSKLFLYCVIGGLVWFWINDRISLKENINRLENNQIALVESHSRQMEITSKTFERLFHKEDSIAKLVGIKPEVLHQVIVNNYSHKDSTIVNIPFKDSVNRDTLKFIAPLKCLTVEGYVTKQGITFTKEEFNDRLYTFLYKVNNKKISFRNKDKVGFDRSSLS